MRYRKKPITVEASQWFENGDHPNDDVYRPFESTGLLPSIPREGKIVRRFRHPHVIGEHPCSKCQIPMQDHGFIDALEGEHTVCPGDWIITGIMGEHYPIKNEIFKLTYERELS